MDIRYSCNQKDFKRYTTEEMRDEMLITGLYKADEVVAVYSHVDRMVTLGCMPVHETVSIDKGIDIWANFGTHYFLERREIGMFNIGKDSTGIVVADGVKYELGYKDCLYITQGTKEVTFASADPEHPAKFYMVSAPAHCAYQTRLIKMADANHRPLGSVDTCNKRTINQFIHPDVLKTCQLSMGMTELAPGSNWAVINMPFDFQSPPSKSDTTNSLPPSERERNPYSFPSYGNTVLISIFAASHFVLRSSFHDI